MQPTSVRLTARLSEVLLDGKWVTGTHFKKEISSIGVEAATQKIGPLHSIAELTFHLLYYLKGINDVFQGQPLTIKDQFSFDAPAITTETEWQNLIGSFGTEAENFILNVGRLSEDALFQNFANSDYGSVEKNINAMIEHAYYHLGQVVLIKKLLKENR